MDASSRTFRIQQPERTVDVNGDALIGDADDVSLCVLSLALSALVTLAIAVVCVAAAFIVVCAVAFFFAVLDSWSAR